MIKLQVTMTEGDKEISITREVDREELKRTSVISDPVARAVNYVLRRMVDVAILTIKE